MMKRKIKLVGIAAIFIAVMGLSGLSAVQPAASTPTNTYKFYGTVYLRNTANTAWIPQENARVTVTVKAHFQCPEGTWPYGMYYYTRTARDYWTWITSQYYIEFDLQGWPLDYDLYSYMSLGTSVVVSNGYMYTYTYYGYYSWGPANNLGTNNYKHVYMRRYTSVYIEHLGN